MWPTLSHSSLALRTPFTFPKGAHPSEIFVYFDIGGVLLDLDWDAFFHRSVALAAKPPKSPEALMAAPGLGEAMRLWATGRMGPYDFSQTYLQVLGHDASTLAKPGAPTPLDVKEASSLIVGPVRARSLRLAKRLRQCGVGIGVLSNAVPWHETDIETTLPLRDVFDVVVFSQDVGCEKPEKDIYSIAHELASRHVARRSGRGQELMPSPASGPALRPKLEPRLERKHVYFVDDTVVNVTAARDFGWNAALVCLANDELLRGCEEGTLGEADFTHAARTSKNLVFGDQAARRVEELFAPMLADLEATGVQGKR